MGFIHEPRPPQNNFATRELRDLLEQGIEPLKRWVREDLSQAPRWMGFHATMQWDNHLLACYLSHFLPKLPPRYDYWQQDVLVVHCPEYQENGPYNRIFTQMSGNCLMPDEFHFFSLEITHAFGHRFIPIPDLRYWLEHGVPPQHAIQDPTMLQDERLLQAIARVEKQIQGTIERATVRVLVPFGTLEWVAVSRQPFVQDQLVSLVHVRGEQVLSFADVEGADLWQWLTAMRHRGYLSASQREYALSEVQLLRIESIQ